MSSLGYHDDVSARTIERPVRQELEAAAGRIRDVVVHTPLVPLHAHGGDPRILLKPEILQPAGSFKIRGIYHAVARLSEAERRRGLSTVSAGNESYAGETTTSQHSFPPISQKR